VFRSDTFGDEAFWGDTLRLHDAIQGADLGGTGPGLAPVDALALGLKVDAAALDEPTLRALAAGAVDLTDPVTTLALLAQDAVVGVRGFPDGTGALSAVGITCALCHSTVDDSFAPGIGERLDGWANRDLDVGAIIALAPDLAFFEALLGVDETTVRNALESWGPGRFDAHLNLDGQVFRPDGLSASVLIPSIFGLAGVDRATYTGWGSIPYWNAHVASLEMGGSGVFHDARLEDAMQFPVAAANGLAHVVDPEDRITEKLASLHAYQLSLAPPPAPEGSFDADAAARGRRLFEGAAGCSECHVPPLFTEPGWNLHTPAEMGVDAFQADRSPTRRYRTTPLRGLHSGQRGGFYHDGRFGTLDDVVEHCDGHFGLGLVRDERADLVQYLLSL